MKTLYEIKLRKFGGTVERIDHKDRPFTFVIGTGGCPETYKTREEAERVISEAADYFTHRFPEDERAHEWIQSAYVAEIDPVTLLLQLMRKNPSNGFPVTEHMAEFVPSIGRKVFRHAEGTFWAMPLFPR